MYTGTSFVLIYAATHACMRDACFCLQVLLDGLPVHEYDHHWLHRNVSIVGQEPTLYARSIRENIIYGMEGE